SGLLILWLFFPELFLPELFLPELFLPELFLPELFLLELIFCIIGGCCLSISSSFLLTERTTVRCVSSVEFCSFSSKRSVSWTTVSISSSEAFLSIAIDSLNNRHDSV